MTTVDEVARFLSFRTGRLWRFSTDGTVEYKPFLGEWAKSKIVLKPAERRLMRAEFMSRMKHEDFGFGASQPTMGQLERWAFDGVCETPDGCRTEPDGGCPHGFRSWMRIAGII